MTGGESAVLVALRNQHQRAVDRQHLVEEDRDVHRARLRHAVVARPGAVVLVPLPDVAFERRLGVDLELVNIDAFAEQLLQWLYEPRVMGHQPEGFIIGMRGKCGARRARLLAPDLPAVGPENAVGFAAQDRDFVFGETVRKEYVALLVEGLDLLRCELHGVLPGDARFVAVACSLVRIHFGSNHDFTPGIHSKSSQLFDLALSSGNHAAWRPSRLPFRARGRTMDATARRSNSTSPVGGTSDGVADTICRGYGLVAVRRHLPGAACVGAGAGQG